MLIYIIYVQNYLLMDEIEDLVGDVNYIDSQKSVTTSVMYSLNFTDNSSDKNDSSGKDTYVLECDDSDDSDNPFHLQRKQSVVNIKDVSTPLTVNRNLITPFQKRGPYNKPVSAIGQQCSYVSKEIFTQTSKTIIELAQIEGLKPKTTDNQTLETQTSFISVVQNKTVEYRVETSECGPQTFTRNEVYDEIVQNLAPCNAYNPLDVSLEDGSSKHFKMHEMENGKSDVISNDGCTTKLTESNEMMDMESDDQQHFEIASGFEVSSKSESDIEEDSLMDTEYRNSKLERAEISSELSEISKSVDDDVKEIYNKLSKSMSLKTRDSSPESVYRRLTPVTEESVKRDSVRDVTPITYPESFEMCKREKSEETARETEFRPKLLGSYDLSNPAAAFAQWGKKSNDLKLPPIQNAHSCPPSPNLNYLFTVTVANGQVSKPGTLSCVMEEQKEKLLDRWDLGAQDLASGESTQVTSRSDSARRFNDQLQLPPIHIESSFKTMSRSEFRSSKAISENPCDSISINDKIKELKLSSKLKPWSPSRATILSSAGSRSTSPTGTVSPNSRLNEAAEKGCEALCAELLRGLRSTLWFEIVETLEKIPRLLSKFWGVITEHRIADLIRQVSVQVDSPRTHVARCACSTIAAILKNTNYTKKPDFYEAMSLLLVKTGSFSRPVRHAANVALDEVVCAVDTSHAAHALCVHAVQHKSALVRCAGARLLVICAALASGGRDLLKARPASAVSARRHVLRSLSALLDDKNAETRKYAERLFTMLRPLDNFEAYYLTDVEVEKATKQMKKYDQLLMTR